MVLGLIIIHIPEGGALLSFCIHTCIQDDFVPQMFWGATTKAGGSKI